MMSEFLEAGGEKPKSQRTINKSQLKSSAAGLKRTEMKRTGRLKPESEKQKGNRGLWKIIKRAMVLAQIRTNGFTSCMECGTHNPKPIDLDHIDGRDWLPENAQLLCRRCHELKHGVPMFSGGNG